MLLVLTLAFNGTAVAVANGATTVTLGTALSSGTIAGANVTDVAVSCNAPPPAPLFFSATDGINGFELWKSDGTEAGTVLVKDINPTGDSLLDD